MSLLSVLLLGLVVGNGHDSKIQPDPVPFSRFLISSDTDEFIVTAVDRRSYQIKRIADAADLPDFQGYNGFLFHSNVHDASRSEERRVGKGCVSKVRFRWS